MPDLVDIPAPPRSMRRCRGYAALAVQGAMLIVILFFWQAFWHVGTGTIRVLWFSQSAPAVVKEVLTVPSKHGWEHEAVLAYRVGDVDFVRHLRIAAQEAETMHPGDTLTVHFVPERPDTAELRADNYPVMFVTVFSAILAVVPGLAAGKLLWNLLIAPWRTRRLLRDGSIASGVILERKQTEGKGACLALTYEYEVPAPDLGQIPRGTVLVQAKAKFPGLDFVGTAVGDSITVVYHPDHPRRSVIYEYADYRFVIPEPCKT
jgi:hypothetical protein